jgi:CRP/FNR family transcriptional regulator
MNGERKDIHNSEVPVLCQACEARHKGICGVLKPDELLYLSQHSVRKSIETGTELVSDDQDIASYSNILSGVVKLTKMLPDGRQQIVGLQFAPDFLGRLFRKTSQTTAESATQVNLCSFPSTLINKMIRQSPDLEHRLHEQALAELDEAREWMLTLGRKTAAEKVASFLFLIARHADPAEDESDGVTFDLPLTRADIADFLGLTIETVSRQMTKLRKDGVIQIENNRHIMVPNIERLAMRARVDT